MNSCFSLLLVSEDELVIDELVSCVFLFILVLDLALLDLALLDIHFGSFSLQWPMIKMLGHYRCLNFGCDPRVVLARHVICTNTNLVHPTWLAGTIPKICVSNVSMRPYLMFILVLICCNGR